MSIIEKVVRREDKRYHPSDESDGDVASNVEAQDTASDERSPSSRIELSGLTERGLISVLENTDLFRAFRFVKRAILAKIFSPNRKASELDKVIMITSAMPGAGKSTLAFNLAVSIAQEQLIDVVLIDADTVRHRLSNVLGMNGSDGLLEILATRNVDIGTFSTDLPGLRFVPSGQEIEYSTELLASQYMSDVLASFTGPDTIVVIDTTPLLVSSEADAIAAHAGETIVIVEAGNTSITEIESALQLLKKSGTSVSFIMNKVVTSGGGAVSDHYYGVY